jgi:hypothetical protein
MVILTAIVILLNWDSIKEVIINDDKTAQRVSKENMFSSTKIDRTSSSTSCVSADGVLDRAIPVPTRVSHHTMWYNLMIVVDFLISHKKSIVICFAAISLYFMMF